MPTPWCEKEKRTCFWRVLRERLGSMADVLPTYTGWIDGSVPAGARLTCRTSCRTATCPRPSRLLVGRSSHGHVVTQARSNRSRGCGATGPSPARPLLSSRDAVGLQPLSACGPAGQPLPGGPATGAVNQSAAACRGPETDLSPPALSKIVRSSPTAGPQRTANVRALCYEGPFRCRVCRKRCASRDCEHARFTDTRTR